MISLKSIAPILLLIFFFWGINTVKAQSKPVDSLLANTFKTDELLPILIESAIKFSPEFKIKNFNEGAANASLKIAKKAIFNALSLLSSYNYGNNISALNNSAIYTGLNLFSTTQTSIYNVGVGFQFPITNIISRKNTIKVSQALVNVASAEKEKTALAIKQEAIKLYQEFKLSFKLMGLSNANKQILEVNKIMSEKSFLVGDLNLQQLTGILEVYNKSVIDVETNTNKFQTNYFMLETFTGTNFLTLLTGSK